MFVSSDVLEKEKDHIEGFAPEVAWVTRACVAHMAYTAHRVPTERRKEVDVIMPNSPNSL